MGSLNLQKTVIPFLKKYKYAFCILLLGLALMWIPTGKKAPKEPIPAVPVSREDILEQKLESILGEISGAGRVRVLLSVREGAATVFETEEDRNREDTSDSQRSSPVTVTDSEHNETGLVRQVNPARYQGAVIVCDGGGDAGIRLRITQAVSRITGLGADHISVLKMK